MNELRGLIEAYRKWWTRDREHEQREARLRNDIERLRSELARVDEELKSVLLTREKDQHEFMKNHMARLEKEMMRLDLNDQEKRLDYECVYQKAIEKLLGGAHMSIPIVGVSDVTNEHCHAEIKELRSWKGGIGQLLSYRAGAHRDHLKLYFYRKKNEGMPSEDMCKSIQKTCSDNGIEPYLLDYNEDHKLSVMNLKTMEQTVHEDIQLEPMEKVKKECGGSGDYTEITQTETGKFECSECYRTFVRKTHLMRHRPVCKGKPDRYGCGECKLIFRSRDQLYYHRKTNCSSRSIIESKVQNEGTASAT
jgi:hypothetical protein